MKIILFLALLPHSATIKWQLPPQAPNVTVQSIKINRNGTLLATMPADAISYNDLTIQGGQLYTYTVIAATSVGDSDPSNSFSIQVPPDPPAFSAGDTFKVPMSAAVRSMPSATAPVVKTLSKGSVGTIIAGPFNKNWWQVQRGYVLESQLRQ